MSTPAIDPTLKNWMYAREMCRRLGFTPDELYLEVMPSGIAKNPVTGETKNFAGPLLSLVILRNDIRFAWTIGVTGLPLAEIADAYKRACTSWNDHSEEWSIEDFRGSGPMQFGPELIVQLRDAGFEVDMSSGMFTGARPHN